MRRRCDTFMRIPMRGAIGSLNAAVAGSIMLFEAVAQRDPTGDAAPPRSASVPELPEGAGPAPEGVAAEPAGGPEPEPLPGAQPGLWMPRTSCRAAPSRRNRRSPDPPAGAPPRLTRSGEGPYHSPAHDGSTAV